MFNIDTVSFDIFLYIYNLDSSTGFHFLQSFQAFGDGSKCTNYNWYHCQQFYYCITSSEFFTPALADGLSMESRG